MPAWAHLLMSYLTFIGRGTSWRLFRGIGDRDLLAERTDRPLVDLSPARVPVVWACCSEGSGRGAIVRLRLPGLDPESIPWDGRRVTAIASAPDGERAIVLELPDEPADAPRVHVWTDDRWSAVETDRQPDASTKLAWLDGTSVVWEASDRRLTLTDLETGSASVGPAACCPAVAADAGRWYAIAGETPVAFELHAPFATPPEPLSEFDFGEPTGLRFTHDGEVCTWTEPRLFYRSKTFVQARGRRRRRVRPLDEAVGGVLGPYGELG